MVVSFPGGQLRDSTLFQQVVGYRGANDFFGGSGDPHAYILAEPRRVVITHRFSVPERLQNGVT